ncbi:unnamed protein product (macronuclear) [Paramecium tetraurelia]|uniref:Uncharacterized protein n=1 Tax=Paramecium tetraurelia TaxID=5888 RepID=A0DBZ4_PARTE|nr:uncharacterized protein GSPATT00015438001 [Paramecium tetraurelia]CAK80561.1 unnamed protein product [Paramecium tetraurelia]|eukprot:XP_001447958.1 hypothetical protein (macronuclear) [Paramecium tetraurelia strain d4-2]
MQTYYKLAFQTLKNFYDLKLISEVEKTQMKELILNQSVHSDVEMNLDQISKFILQKIKKLRQSNKKLDKKQDSLISIEEETDEDDFR